VCLQSFALDKVHADWNKEKTICEMRIMMGRKFDLIWCGRYQTYDDVFFNSPVYHIRDRFREIYEKCEIKTLKISVPSNVDQSWFHELIHSCSKIPCQHLEINPIGRIGYFESGSGNIFNEEVLRQLLTHKNYVEIGVLCNQLSFTGLQTLWEDLKNGKFMFLSITVGRLVADQFFNMMGTMDNSRSCCDYHQIEGVGRMDESEKYGIWRNPYIRNMVCMSRIYSRCPPVSTNYPIRWVPY
ncbi:hypothetical protein PFISCL1PPCAC_21887, partial [Pristionchus fissidentatus]